MYDAILFLSFGGPEGPDDVMPFLENVLRGRNVPRERMLEVAQHYQNFGGVSPINEQNRDLIAALEKELSEHGPDLPIYWGNRNWHPLLTDTLQKMKDDGIQRAITFVTSAFSSYSGCRQYREDIMRAREAIGPGAPHCDKLRVFYNHPGYIETILDRLNDAFAKIPEQRRDKTQIAFTAHSIPDAMSDNCKYVAQLTESCRLVTDAISHPRWKLVYQSRSGPPTQPWLEPDICDYLEELKETGTRDVIICPIGFISDHMEVLFDLDTEAREKAEELGITMVRAATAGTHPKFVRMIRDLIDERHHSRQERPALGPLGPSHDVCPNDCCLSGRPPMRSSGATTPGRP